MSLLPRFSRWKALGRHILKGAKAKEVIVPVVIKEEPQPETETKEELRTERRAAVAQVIGFKVVRAVFALSDTEGKERQFGIRRFMVRKLRACGESACTRTSV
jgi:hypothetical protein